MLVKTGDYQGDTSHLPSRYGIMFPDFTREMWTFRNKHGVATPCLDGWIRDAFFYLGTDTKNKRHVGRVLGVRIFKADVPKHLVPSADKHNPMDVWLDHMDMSQIQTEAGPQWRGQYHYPQASTFVMTRCAYLAFGWKNRKPWLVGHGTVLGLGRSQMAVSNMYDQDWSTWRMIRGSRQEEYIKNNFMEELLKNDGLTLENEYDLARKPIG